MLFTHLCEAINLLAFWHILLKLVASKKHYTTRDISWKIIDKQGGITLR